MTMNTSSVSSSPPRSPTVFRNRRFPNGFRNILGEDIGGQRIYTDFRWGIAILGLEIGDRGRSREYVRRQMGLAS